MDFPGMITFVSCVTDKVNEKPAKESSLLREKREHAGHAIPTVS